MPDWVKKLARRYLDNPLTIALGGDQEEKLAEGIKLYAIPTTASSKHGPGVYAFSQGDVPTNFTTLAGSHPREAESKAVQQRVTLRLLTSWFDIPWEELEAIKAMIIPTLDTLILVIGANGFVVAANVARTVASSVTIVASFGAAEAEPFEFQTDIERVSEGIDRAVIAVKAEVATLFHLQHQHVVCYYQAWVETDVDGFLVGGTWDSRTTVNTLLNGDKMETTNNVGFACKLLISVTLILLFGEIIAQSVCSRYGLAIGATMAPVVRVLVWICFPIAYPISKLLDYIPRHQRELRQMQTTMGPGKILSCDGS